MTAETHEVTVCNRLARARASVRFATEREAAAFRAALARLSALETIWCLFEPTTLSFLVTPEGRISGLMLERENGSMGYGVRGGEAGVLRELAERLHTDIKDALVYGCGTRAQLRPILAALVTWERESLQGASHA